VDRRQYRWRNRESLLHIFSTLQCFLDFLFDSLALGFDGGSNVVAAAGGTFLRQYKHGALLHDSFMFVEKNFRGDCSVETLAKQMGYSGNYLSRYFMKSIGMSFHSYVTQYRLEQVCYLMRNTNEPILRCAMDCGFTSLRSFNRNFGLYIGMTPTEYREQMNH